MFTPLARYGLHRRLGAIVFAAALVGPAIAAAAPLIIEETVKIPAPDPTYIWPASIAIDGDWMLASGIRYDWDTFVSDSSTWLYHRQVDGSWAQVRKLHQYFVQENGDEPTVTVAMRGGVAVILKEHASWIFELSGGNWVSVPSPIQTDGMDVAVDGGTIVVTTGQCSWETNAYRKGANGAWALVRHTDPEPEEFCENEDTRGDTDVSGNAVIVATWTPPGSARIFEGPFGTTPTMTRLVAPSDPPYGGHMVAIENNSAVIGHHVSTGLEAFTRTAIGQWSHSGSLQRPDALASSQPNGVEMSGNLAIASQASDPTYGFGAGSGSVFQRNSDGTYRYAAKLMISDRGPQNFFVVSDISGRRVAGGSVHTQSLYVFDLPTTLANPPTMQDNFQDGNASDWTPLAGGTFTVATTSSSRVYRQSSIAGNAASLWNSTDRENQTIEADIKPTAYATSAGDKWFGLVARYTSASNYYYVTLRNNNTLLLRKMVNGVFTTLDSATLPITLNRSYRVRLEVIGTRLRVFVDNQLLAEASDSALDHGQAGVMMYKTQADYDNVLVSSNPRTTLASYAFRDGDNSEENWETLGAWTWNETSLVQSDVASGARAIVGIATDDQVVQARMQRTGAAGANNWFGLATRYRDQGNYYYVTLRNNNTVSLRKLVNGAIVELDAAALTIASNTWYRVRFEAVGTQLRVYINDVLRLDATDSSHASGRYGPVMYRTAAHYDDVLATEP